MRFRRQCRVRQYSRRTEETYVGCHTFRQSFATELIRAGYDIRTVQELLGHTDVRPTMIYTHVLNRGGLGVGSPADMSASAQNAAPMHALRQPARARQVKGALSDGLRTRS